MRITNPKTKLLKPPPEKPSHIPRGIIVLAELNMVGYCVEVATPSKGGANSPFRPASDEDAKREVVGEKALPDRNQQFFLPVFALALIQAVDENGVRKGSEV